MKKQLLLIAATHGNEPIGIEVIKNLENSGLEKYFDVLIANPKALKNKKRFMEADLNRSYPGRRNSKIYEQKIAYDNLKIANQYRYVIDIHEASEGWDDFIIIPRKKLSSKFPLSLIDLSKILYWPEPRGAIGQILKNSIELEFGMKNRNREKAVKKATKIIGGFIQSIHGQQKQKRRQEIFYVYDKLMLSKLKNQEIILKDFKLIKLNEEKFYPLLVNQYKKDGIACYKMRKFDA